MRRIRALSKTGMRSGSYSRDGDRCALLELASRLVTWSAKKLAHHPPCTQTRIFTLSKIMKTLFMQPSCMPYYLLRFAIVLTTQIIPGRSPRTLCVSDRCINRQMPSVIHLSFFDLYIVLLLRRPARDATFYALFHSCCLFVKLKKFQCSINATCPSSPTKVPLTVPAVRRSK